MPKYTTEQIRNIALVGHGGAGKTSLAEAFLFNAGVTTRQGSVTDKTSMLDFMDEEKERGCSIDSAVCHFDTDGVHFNVIDTPGAPDFIGPAIAALIGADTAVCVVSASAGIEINTRRMMEKAKDYGLARAIIVNKIDAPNVDLAELVEHLHESFGKECVCMNLPAGGGKSIIDCFANKSGDADFGDVADKNSKITDAIVESDEAMMEEYLEAGEIAPEKLEAAIGKAVAAGTLVPVFFTSATHNVGVKECVTTLARCAPSPITGKRRELTTDDGTKPVDPKDSHFVGQVFKVTGDPKSNIKYSVIRILSGQLKADATLLRGDDKKGQRPGQLHTMQGSDHPDLDAGIAGDIVGLAKVELNIGDVVHTGTPGEIGTPKFPTPMYALAIEPKSRGDADKVSTALHRFTDEDPCFKAERDAVTHELVIHGVGDLHLRTILSRIDHYFKLQVDTKPPKIPYRETITGRADNVEYTHKKQSGGAGQFGRVIINVMANERGKGYEFVDKIFGGSIDQQFRPSVDKGVRAVMAEGVIAGYPVVDVKVELIDGKTHPVDSKDIAFQIAGREAFKIGFEKAKPVLLEPIVNLEVTIPADKMGDITGDVASRRGRPVGQDMLPGGLAVVKAQVPLAELSDYHSRLSSITGGQGSYTMDLSHYEVVPGNVQQQIVEAAKKARAEAAAAH